MITTGRQIREGRELIAMSQADLAEVVRAELAADMPTSTSRDSAAIRKVLEAAGVAFVQGE